MNTDDLKIAIQHKIVSTGLSQTKIAEMLEINRSSLSRFLSSESEISGGAVMKLSNWVDETGSSTKQNQLLNKLSQTLMDLVESLNDTEKLAAAGAVLAIAQIRAHKSNKTIGLIEELNSFVDRARVQKNRGGN